MKIKFNKKEINSISKKIIGKILKESNDNATILALSGDLGAGKTTLTKELAKDLGVKEEIISPTFVIMKIYKINKRNSKFKKLIHIDAYRLDSHLELEKIGFHELYKDKDNLIILEWPERVKEFVEDKALFAYLSHLDEETRLIEL